MANDGGAGNAYPFNGNVMVAHSRLLCEDGSSSKWTRVGQPCRIPLLRLTSKQMDGLVDKKTFSKKQK